MEEWLGKSSTTRLTVQFWMKFNVHPVWFSQNVSPQFTIFCVEIIHTHCGSNRSSCKCWRVTVWLENPEKWQVVLLKMTTLDQGRTLAQFVSAYQCVLLKKFYKHYLHKICTEALINLAKIETLFQILKFVDFWLIQIMTLSHLFTSINPEFSTTYLKDCCNKRWHCLVTVHGFLSNH